MTKSKQNKFMMYTFIIGAVLLGLAIAIGNLVPELTLGPIAHMLLYIALVAPWVLFIIAILIPSKKDQP